MKKYFLLIQLIPLFSPFLWTQNDGCVVEILNADFPSAVQPREIVAVTVVVRNNSTSVKDTTRVGVYSTTYGSKFPGPVPFLVGETLALNLQPNEERTLNFEVQMPILFREYIEMFGQKSRRWAFNIRNPEKPWDRTCEYPIEFNVNFLPVNLEMKLLSDIQCISERATLNYQLTNLGTTTVGPIFIRAGACALVGPNERYYCSKVIEEIAPGQSITFSQNYDYASERYPNYGTQGYTARVDASLSNVSNINPNNSAGTPFRTTPFCPSFKLSTAICHGVGIYNEDDKIYVSGVLTDYAKVEIIGANTGWQVQTICDGNCEGNTRISNLKAGEYTVKVQLNGSDGSDCYTERTITVEGKSQPSVSANCNGLNFVPSTNQIEVQNLNTTFSQIQIIGRNTDWQVVTICSGDCAENTVIPNLQAGEYAVKVQLNSDDGTDCYREEKVMVGEDSGNSNGGNNDGEDIEGVNCEGLIFSTNGKTITVSGLTAASEKVELIGANTDWQVVTICDDNCRDTQEIRVIENGEFTVKVNQLGEDGSYCYREEKVIVDGIIKDENEEVVQNGPADCDNLFFKVERGRQLFVTGLTAAYNKVEFYGLETDWQTVTVCDGDCAVTQKIPNLPSSQYTVKVQQRGADGSYCYWEGEIDAYVAEINQGRANESVVEAIGLFPNPVKSILNLEISPLKNRNGQILIFNHYGQKVLSLPRKTFYSETEQIDISQLENGFYYLTIQAERTPLISQRFVVESYK